MTVNGKTGRRRTSTAGAHMAAGQTLTAVSRIHFNHLPAISWTYRACDSLGCNADLLTNSRQHHAARGMDVQRMYEPGDCRSVAGLMYFFGSGTGIRTLNLAVNSRLLYR